MYINQKLTVYGWTLAIDGRADEVAALAEAKNRLSEVVNRALEEGPQRITRGNDVVLVISEADYQSAKGERQRFGEYLSSASLEGLGLKRDESSLGDISL